MFTYEDLQYLCAFAEIGSLTQVSQQFHISQPTVTRSMKRLEDEFGVPLFVRTRNTIRLNENGVLAAEEAAILLRQHDGMLRRVRAHDSANHTISIGTGAAVPLPQLIQRLSEFDPDLKIITQLKKPDELLEGLENGSFQLIVLPYEPHDASLTSVKIGEEHLMFFLPKKHRFAKRESLTLGEMNGENLLLFSDIGFWHDIVTRKMPDSKFLVQSERYSFEELILNSVLPCFTTDLAHTPDMDKSNRSCVPITDPEVNVSYYLVCREKDRRKYAPYFREVS